MPETICGRTECISCGHRAEKRPGRRRPVVLFRDDGRDRGPVRVGVLDRSGPGPAEWARMTLPPECTAGADRSGSGCRHLDDTFRHHFRGAKTPSPANVENPDRTAERDLTRHGYAGRVGGRACDHRACRSLSSPLAQLLVQCLLGDSQVLGRFGLITVRVFHRVFDKCSLNLFETALQREGITSLARERPIR